MEALLPDNIARLQQFYLKKRYEKTKPYLHKKPYFQLNEAVRKIEVNNFRQRADKNRFSKQTYRITKILSNAVPIAYYISQHPGQLFYKEQLSPVSDEKDIITTKKRILAIISDKKFATKWLRNGKAIEYQIKYLVRITEAEPSRYLTKAEIEQYDNGSDLLTAYEKKKLE